MDIFELIRCRRSIRKYQPRQIPREALEQVLEAGEYAPNAGGGQRRIIIAIHDRETCEKIGRLNLNGFDRGKLLGGYVSQEQPSIIDDPTLKSGFYGAPTVCAIFGPKNFLYSVPDAFCCAENMVLAATELGLASCIVARGEETFDGEAGRAFLSQWEIPEDFVARCFVLLGYCDGPYPAGKPRVPGRVKIVE